MSKLTMQPLRNVLFPIGLIAIVAVLIMIVVGLSFKGIVQATLQNEAERKAVLWAQEFMVLVPDHHILADTEEASAEQFEMIKTTSGGEGIFRFNFFSPAGELIYTSDDGKFFAPGESTHNSTALSVYSSKQNNITIKSGEDIPNRPDTYVEAYILAISAEDRMLGVMEIYVDVSSLASTLTGIVKSLGALVILVSGIAFLISASFLVFRNQKLYSARARETWLAAILNHAPFEVVIKDADGKIRAISQNVIDEVNLREEDFIGKTTADFLPADISQEYMSADRDVVRTGEATQKEVLETINGTTRYSLSSKFPLVGSDGQVVGVCSITNDITDLKLSEAKLAQAQKMETVGQLSGGIAHDFNNLLSVVSGSLQLLEHSKDEGEREKLTRVALRAIEHGSALTKQMLALSRRSPLISMPTNLNSTLAEFEGFISNILPANIDFHVLPAPASLNAVVDVSMLQNALLNVALNSQAAMPNGGKLTISADTAIAPAGFPSAFVLGGKCASLTITDNGIGIAQDEINSVFEPFYTTCEVGKGSGLGLSMVKGFVEQSNGIIQLDSKVSFGTTLRIFLPLTFETADVKNRPPRKIVTRPPGEEKGTVLVVEDNEQLLNIIALKLERDGFEVITKQSGDDALEILNNKSGIQLVLSDLVMPGDGQGIDVLRRAKSLHPSLPVILMSGYADINKSNEKGLELADKFIEKPLALGKLSGAIEDLITG
jgi:PAS domain S-box-containing protein